VSDAKSNPPTRAIWFLRHACPGDKEALTGDLIERFREGQTRGWFWRQVLVAFIVGVLGEIRRHWPHFFYAIAGTVAPAILFRGVKPFPIGWWTTLPWPWFEYLPLLGLWTQLVLAALPVLAAGLVICRIFRWVSLLRTVLINLALITLGHYAFVLFLPSNPYNRAIIFPSIVQMRMVILFSSFLVAAWLGCASPRNTDELGRHAPARPPQL
jgi:hypothetical protein